MADGERAYLPAAGHDWALPLYDPLVKLLGADRAKGVLLQQAHLSPTERVLDIGCGTGTLAAMIQRAHAGVEVVGLDPDPKALARARRKAERAHLSIRFDQGFSEQLSYPDASFDHVFSTFMLHHLGARERRGTLAEVRRVLKPGGAFHLADFEGSEQRPGGWWVRRLHESHRLDDNTEAGILALLEQAGLRGAAKIARGGMLFGYLRIGYFQAFAPPSAGAAL